MTNTPNHQQTAKIARDISALQQGRPVEHWQGNSYSGHVSGGIYRLVHWSTEIALFDDTGACIVFDAQYYSTTTRSFQGRILAAMSPRDPMYGRVRAELAKPTGDRGRIYLDTEALSA